MTTIEGSDDDAGSEQLCLSTAATNANNFPPSSSSSSFARTDSGTSVEIPPPPVLHRSAEEPLLQTTTTTNNSSTAVSAFSLGMDNGTTTNGGGGMINVENIFSAMLDDTPPVSSSSSSAMNNNSTANTAVNYVSNNNIFHNFTSGSSGGNTNNDNNEGLSILIAPKKSSHHIGGTSNVINAYNPNLISTAPSSRQDYPQYQHQRHNSLGTQQQQQQLQQISKSMNTTTTITSPSFLRPIISHSESNDQYDSHYHGNHGSNNNNGVFRRNSGQYHHPLRPSYGNANSSIISGSSSRVRSGSREDNAMMNNHPRRISHVDVPRHAGYLLKRSNNPYVDTTAATTTGTGVAGNSKVVIEDTTQPPPPPVQELLLNSFDGSGIEPLFTLPFGGVDSLENTIDHKAAADMGYDYDEDEYEEEEEEEDQCFCAPLLQLLTGRRKQRRRDEKYPLLLSEKKNSDFGSLVDSREDYRQQQQQEEEQLLLHEEEVVVSQIPLKEPARSDPVPIGGEQQQQQQQFPQQPQHFPISAAAAASGTNSADVLIESGMTTTNRSIMNRMMSRSYSNGSRLNETVSTLNKSSIKSTSTTAAATKKKKEYPPPPPDYIDPRDGHIWRAKYCVLEEGILYFYRNAMEGESDEAQAERNESRHYFHVAATTTTSTAASTTMLPSLGGGGGGGGLSSSPSVPIPIDSSAGKTAASMVTMSTDSSTRTSLSRMGKKDLFDLSKSPMPMKKSDFFHLRVPPPSSSTTTNQTGGNASLSAATSTPRNNTTPTPTLRQSPVLHHSNSTSTFHHDTDILWEKRVALDCVGAVRSSAQDHGDHAFELLAYGTPDGDEQSDASTRNSGEHHQQQQHEIIDRLILRAGSSDDMNTWMFQFHRSLASYMRQIVNSALNNRANNVLRMRPDSPVHQLYQHRRIGTPVGSSTMSKHKQQHSSSPLGASSFGSGYSPSTGPSLSHGHGRNALYRRKVRDDASSPTPVGSPESFTKSERSDSVESQKKAVAVLGLRDVRKNMDGKASSPISTAAAAPRKYIPPQLRKAGPSKYIPPHLRKKMEQVDKGSKEGEFVASVEKQVPLNDSIVDDDDDDDGIKEKRAKLQTREDDGAESDTPSDSALSTTSSLLSRQMDDVSDDVMLSSSNVRRGGCADPTVILGSILDDIFIPRKASVLEKARLQPHGCIGGGLFTSMRYATVEEDSIPFDDVMNNTGRRSFLSGLKWEVGASSECGVRNANEDSYVVINNLDEMISSQGLTSFASQDVGQTKQQSLFAIFDGHVGNQAARFSAEKFPDMLMEEQSVLASRDSAILSSIEDRTLEVLRNAFDRLDREFCSLCTRDGRDWDCGSTALAALVVDDVVTLANLGDCRGVVCRVVSSGNAESADTEWHELDPEDDEDMLWDRANGAFSSGERLFWREVTETHSPLLQEEEERIKAANGWIIHETEIPTGQIHRMDFFDEDVVDIVKRCFADRLGQHRSDPARSIQIARTCGDLAVSRAIGDRDFKAAYNLPQKTQTIIEQRTEIAMSWDGPPVFIYPEDHSGRFKGDLVSNVPDIKFFKIGQEGVIDEFLLMACDGLWDVMDGDDAVRIAKNLLFDKKLSAKDGAERLAELAKHLGSSDNITVILIRFYWEEIDKK